MNIGRLIFNTTGIMTKKEILRRAELMGKEINSAIFSNEGISSNKMQTILSNTLGKRSNRIKLITTEEEATKGIEENLKIPHAAAKDLSKRLLSCVIPKGTDKDSKTLLNIRTTCFSNEVFGNVFAHETEHALFEEFSLKSLINNIINNKLMKKSHNNAQEKYADVINTMGFDFETSLFSKVGKFGRNACFGWTKYKASIDGLLKQTKCKSVEELDSMIEMCLIDLKIDENLNNKRLRYLFIKSLLYSLKDEVRAYKVGGTIQKEFYKKSHIATGKHATNSTMNSLLYDEACKVLEKEKKLAFKDIIKSLFKSQT